MGLTDFDSIGKVKLFWARSLKNRVIELQFMKGSGERDSVRDHGLGSRFTKGAEINGNIIPSGFYRVQGLGFRGLGLVP